MSRARLARRDSLTMFGEVGVGGSVVEVDCIEGIEQVRLLIEDRGAGGGLMAVLAVLEDMN